MTVPAESRRLYAYYGDDFTGSTDVLEALGLYGVPAVLFTSLPDERQLAAFSHCRAIGIAGESRSRNPQWMSLHLPRIFASLRSLGAPVNHYKVCSTFDSAPHVGNIGRVIEIGKQSFAEEFVPVIVGAPHLGRYVLFGNLFAAAEGVVYRIDRHPTMRHHPVTPASEADLRLHLALQTAGRVGLVDLLALREGRAETQLQAELAGGAEAVVFDGADEAALQETAQLVWERASERPLFAVGSSGFTHGLLAYWQSAGLLGPAPARAKATGVERLLVMSGSCSPITGKQIRRAIEQGFEAVPLTGRAPWEQQARQACEWLARGKSVVLYSALGNDIGNSPRLQDQAYGEAYSIAMGRLLRELLLSSGVRRVVVAGGDTSSHAVQQLGMTALTFTASLTPGAPLCRGHAPGSSLDNLELVLKGGQIGPEDFFERVLRGHA